MYVASWSQNRRFGEMPVRRLFVAIRAMTFHTLIHSFCVFLVFRLGTQAVSANCSEYACIADELCTVSTPLSMPGLFDKTLYVILAAPQVHENKEMLETPRQR